jgi:hypothetical protein
MLCNNERIRYYILDVKIFSEDSSPFFLFNILRDSFGFHIKETKKCINCIFDRKETKLTIKSTLSNVHQIKSKFINNGFYCRIEDIFDM